MNGNEWKKFEASGEIAYYLQYKQAIDTTGNADEENTDADHDDGASAPRNEDRRI